MAHDETIRKLETYRDKIFSEIETYRCDLELLIQAATITINIQSEIRRLRIAKRYEKQDM